MTNTASRLPDTSTRAADAYRARFGIWPWEAAGLVALRRARASGRLVGVYDGTAAGLDTDGGRWSTVCEDHATVCSHETLALARSFATDPLAWCETCQEGDPMTGPLVLAHARRRPSKRSPHRTGRLTPDHVLDRDPARRTLCGAEPTDRDLSNRQAHTKAGRPYLTCVECAAIVDEETR